MISSPSRHAAADRLQAAPNPIRIVIALEQQFVADMLEAVLGRQAGMIVVGNVSWMDERAERIAELAPDIVILVSEVARNIALTAAAATASLGRWARITQSVPTTTFAGGLLAPSASS